MQCRTACGACCIAPSITQAFYGMPRGKKAGEACVHLDAHKSCLLFNDPRRPSCCHAFQPEPDICGADFDKAIQTLNWLELETHEKI